MLRQWSRYRWTEFECTTSCADISSDFAVEVCMSPVSDNKPQMGGLLIWKDKDNFLRFEKGVYGQHEMRLHGYMDGKRRTAGRGLLPVEDDDEVYLRLERSGDEFSAYCSTDGENWLTCGTMNYQWMTQSRWESTPSA